MRIILYTGKGGVGKTSVAAATALRCAERGYRTLVMSTDLAHSLADSFDEELAAVPKPVAHNLWAQEVDIFHEIREHWGTIQEWLTGVLAWRGLDELVSEEMTILPGMDELSSLLLITDYSKSGRYDVVIVDCAPTGETLRLLSFPEVARWWLKNILPVQRRAYQVLRPVVRPFSDIPLPTDDVFDSIKDLLGQLGQMHQLLANPEISSVRLVLNPEKMVIKEAQRTFTYLNLYGYAVDAIICNRLIPEAVHDRYFAAWKGIQEKYSQLIDESFAPLPVLRVPLFDQEVVGMEMLGLMAESVFGDDDPAKIYFRGRALSIEKESGGYVLSIPLPFTKKEDIELLRSGDELVTRVGNYKRNLILPRALVGLPTREAKFEGNELKIHFARPEGAATDQK